MLRGAAEREGGRSGARRYADAALALVVVLIVGTMIVPLPTPLLDVLLAGNLSLAIVVLLVAMYVPDGLAFTSFPTLLLVATLFRLALNVGSTRLILLQADAGAVIRAFGELVVQGNYVVGGVVFLILTLVQYLVIARGSERVAEVGARFTLDAMPGKQMAIDAELRSGGLGLEEARRRRRQLSRESQFYGAMDGAMKFVKGDAVAGIVITGINLVGGVAVGVGMHGMALTESLRRYGLLTIGDGLVAQISSLLVCTAAGLVVTRVASEDEGSSLGDDVGRQIFGNPRVLAIAAAFLVVLALVPGLPTAPFLVLAALFGGIAWRLSRRAARGRTPELVRTVEALVLEVGSALSSPPGSEHGPAEEAVRGARERVLAELGLAVPEIAVAERGALPPRGYVLSLHGTPIARGELDDGASLDRALTEVLERALRRHAAELVGLQEVQAMLDELERSHPALVRHVVPKPVSLVVLAGVLRRLVGEGVSIRPLRDILEALAVHAAATQDPAALSELVRGSLRRHLTHVHARDGVIDAFLVDPEIEETIRDAVRGGGGAEAALPPATARDVLEVVRAAIARTEGRVVLLTRPDVRRHLRRLLEAELPEVVVLAYPELDPAVEVRARGRVSL